MVQRILVSTDNGRINGTLLQTNDKLVVDYIELNSSDLLTEYDCIILDFNQPYRVSREKHNEITKFSDSANKCLIYVLNKISYNQDIHNYPMIDGIIASDSGPNIYFTHNTKGKNYELTKECNGDIIKKYLESSNKDWQCSLILEHVSNAIPLALNSEGKTIAFRTQANASIYFLPMLIGQNSILLECILAIIKNTNTSSVKPWVIQYSFPKLDESRNKINVFKKEIEAIAGLMEIQEEMRNKYERIRNVLMYYDGDILHSVCREVFNEIGIRAVDGVEGREDLVFIFNNWHFVIEVKGSTKSASKKNVSQLNSHATQYENDNEVKAKRILLINAWREFPIEERGSSDKPIFPNDIMKLVNLTEVCLMTTQQLFVFYCHYLEGKLIVEDIIKTIYSTKGPLANYNDLDIYKIKG